MKKNIKVLFLTVVVALMLILGVVCLSADEATTAATVTASGTTGDPEYPETVTITPKFVTGGAENWRGSTWFILGPTFSFEQMLEIKLKLYDGTYTTTFVIKNETDGSVYTISKYYYDHNDKLWADANGKVEWSSTEIDCANRIFRLCASDYGIPVIAGNIYTITGTIKDGEQVIYNIESAVGAYTPLAEKLGVATGPENGFVPPHSYDEADIVVPEEPAKIASGTTGNLTWVLTSDGVLTISGKGNIPYSSSQPWSDYDSSITKVIIEDGIEEIADFVFADCTLLTEITIPKSVEFIHCNAFENCVNLKNVYITDIASWCNISYRWGDGGEYYSPWDYIENVYLNGELITELVLPEGITKISPLAFYNFKKITSVTFPKSLKYVGDEAFIGCSSLESIIIPENNIQWFGDCVFRDCPELTNLYINDIANWCNYDFYTCIYHNVTTNPLYYIENLYINGVLVEDLVIPEGVTSIGEQAFIGCNFLTSVTIPVSVTTIGSEAFLGCSSLQTVYYTGSQLNWNQISIGWNNSSLTNAKLIFINLDSSGIIGDINGDSAITNKDRFLLNRYLANMTGYTNINKNVADINGDGYVTSDDAVILERHLFGWIGYEDLDAFHNTTTVTPTNVPKWDMSFSSNAVTIDLVLKEGTLDANKNYLFIAENSKGLHYTGIIEAGQTSASFSVKAMQMPRGEMYSYYIIPEGLVLAGNKDTYCIGKSVVPLFKGNMITSVKSGDRTIAKNGYVFIGDGLTINWDGSYGVDNFKLVVTLNGSEIYNKTFNHDGPGTVTISADKILAKGTGTLIISGYVEPSSASDLATAVSVWTGNVVEAEKTTDAEVDPVDLLNEDALALYNKSEAAAHLQLETYYYWQAFSDELTSGTHWGSKWQGVRADISNVVNGVLSSPSTLISSNSKALIKQAIKTRLLELIDTEEKLRAEIQDEVEEAGRVEDYASVASKLGPRLELRPLFKAGNSISDSDLLGIIKKIDLRSFNGTNNPSDIKEIFESMTVFYNGNSYKITDLFDVTDDSAVALKDLIKQTKNAKAAQQMGHVSNIKQLQIFDVQKFKDAFGLDWLDGVELASKGIVFATDMYSLYYLNERFDEIKEELYEIEGASSGVFKEAISEVINDLKKEYFEQFIGEFVIFVAKTGTDLYYGKLVTWLSRSNPYTFIAVAANGILTCLANTDEVNKGMLTLPHIVEAMNDTIGKIEYTYSLFMLNPSNERYYELKALFAAYKFQVELGAEIYMNLSLADHNSYLKRFVRFINPFDKEDKMPETIQGCYDEDIKKLNYVLTWFGFN